MLAALIRAGIYPFHLWLLPANRSQVNVAERLLLPKPVLCGLWLLGWSVELGERLHLVAAGYPGASLSIAVGQCAGGPGRRVTSRTTQPSS